MEKQVDWFLKLIRIAGVNFPGAASFVQIQAEIDSANMMKRVEKLEDPISYIHEDVPEVSRIIYKELTSKNSINLEFKDAFYKKYSRAIAVLDSKGLITKESVLGSKLPIGILLKDPSYIIYMCVLSEDSKKMQQIFNIVDGCEDGEWLNGDAIKNEINLPLPVIRAVFDIFESNGYGLCSKELGACNYMGNS